jgi:DNA mismatch repair protein MutS
MTGLTPMMQQYLQIKEQYRDALLFFRLGDFYEMFFEDAITASRDLEITLTGRDCGLEERAPMCGVPYHAVENYIAKLIEKGHKVAICEQTQDPSEARGLVERQVVRVITPGTLIESSMLDEKSNNYLVSIFKDGEEYGLAGVDISTGEFFISQITGDNANNKLIDELTRLYPREILVHEDFLLDKSLVENIKQRYSSCITPYHDWAYQSSNAQKKLLNHFQVNSLEAFGCQEMDYGICAAGALMEYLSETQKTALTNITKIKSYYPNTFMVLDASTRRNLELTETIRGKDRRGSLLWLLDRTQTAMGGRLLKQWIQQPLIDKPSIDSRLDGITELLSDPLLLEDLRGKLKSIYDLERLISRIAYGTANARDLLSLKQSLEVLPEIDDILKPTVSRFLSEARNNLDPLQDIYELISRSIADNPPVSLREGNIIRSGYNSELDEYRLATAEGKNWIAALEQHEKERTGIKTLKVGFNKVFGYYIEVTKSYLEMVPDTYIRKQTLANSERYITPELKEMEDKILGAEEKSIRLEYQLFSEIRESVGAEVRRIQSTASTLAQIDALCSLAKVSQDNGYIRPEIRTDGALEIQDGRHPVVEKTLSHGLFVPNNTQI